MHLIVIGACFGLLTALAIIAPRSIPDPSPITSDIEILAQVKLKDTDEPVIGVTVTLTGKRPASAYQACVTDENGAVRMQVTKPGTYKVRVTTDDFEIAETEVKVVAGDKQLSIQLLLTRKDTAG
jgi:hypothetical protein